MTAKRISYIEQCRAYGTTECEQYRQRIFKRFELVAEDLARVYCAKSAAHEHGYRDANRWLAKVPNILICGPWNVTHDDEALINHAEAQAERIAKRYSKAYGRDVQRAVFIPRTIHLLCPVATLVWSSLFLQRLNNIHRTAGLRTAINMGTVICEQHQIEPPDGNLSLISQVGRLTSGKWWRRRLRVLSGRRLEQLQRELGRVHKRAGIYASDLTVARRRSQKNRNQALLEAFVAINQHGEEYTLAELSELGLANPSHRYSEMMLRIRDTEAEALRLGHEGLFFTLTCPSKYHPVHSKSCQRNPRYNGASPRQAHQYMTDLWAKIRSKLARRGIGTYGLRVVEPHHDGTPHWHAMLWVAPEQAMELVQILREYALNEDGDEPGARIHRFTFERIRQSKGGATSYLAKYIGKGTNHAKAGDLDQYGHDIVTSAARIESWAATWGIRQFQFIGLPSVSVWRELRKVNKCTESEFHQWELTFGYEPATTEFTHRLRDACDSGQWDQFVRLMGGPMLPRKFRPARPWTVNRHDTEKADGMARGQYGETVKTTYGVEIKGCEYLTRFYRWEVQRGKKRDEGSESARSAPWIHVNNCTGGKSAPPVPHDERIKIMIDNRWESLPAWQVAEKIDAWLLDTEHMKRVMTPKTLTAEEKQAQARNFNNYITSAEYQAELEHRREVDKQIQEMAQAKANGEPWPPVLPPDDWNELREVFF